MKLRSIFFALFALMLFIGCANEKTKEYPDKLLGLNIQYNYANDREYNVKLEEDGLSYRYVSGSKPDKWWGKFPYRHASLEDGHQVVAWFEEGYGDYITLIIDLDKKKLFGSGIIAGEEVHFQPAVISSIVFE